MNTMHRYSYSGNARWGNWAAFVVLLLVDLVTVIAGIHEPAFLALTLLVTGFAFGQYRAARRSMYAFSIHETGISFSVGKSEATQVNWNQLGSLHCGLGIQTRFIVRDTSARQLFQIDYRISNFEELINKLLDNISKDSLLSAFRTDLPVILRVRQASRWVLIMLAFGGMILGIAGITGVILVNAVLAAVLGFLLSAISASLLFLFRETTWKIDHGVLAFHNARTDVQYLLTSQTQVRLSIITPVTPNGAFPTIAVQINGVNSSNPIFIAGTNTDPVAIAVSLRRAITVAT